eukprot:gene3947-biopygen1672
MTRPLAVGPDGSVEQRNEDGFGSAQAVLVRSCVLDLQTSVVASSANASSSPGAECASVANAHIVFDAFRALNSRTFPTAAAAIASSQHGHNPMSFHCPPPHA